MSIYNFRAKFCSTLKLPPVPKHTYHSIRIKRSFNTTSIPEAISNQLVSNKVLLLIKRSFPPYFDDENDFKSLDMNKLDVACLLYYCLEFIL